MSFFKIVFTVSALLVITSVNAGVRFEFDVEDSLGRSEFTEIEYFSDGYITRTKYNVINAYKWGNYFVLFNGKTFSYMITGGNRWPRDFMKHYFFYRDDDGETGLCSLEHKKTLDSGDRVYHEVLYKSGKFQLARIVVVDENDYLVSAILLFPDGSIQTIKRRYY